MREADLMKLKGDVVVLDLVSGLQVVTEIKEVGTYSSTIGKPIIFQVQPQPADPSLPPGPNNPMVGRVNAQPVGGPFAAQTLDDTPIDNDHIIFAHPPVEDIKNGYLQMISGIQIAGADALNALDKGGKIQL